MQFLALGCKHLNVIYTEQFLSPGFEVEQKKMHNLVQEPVTKLDEGNIIARKGARPSCPSIVDQQGDLEV